MYIDQHINYSSFKVPHQLSTADDATVDTMGEKESVSSTGTSSSSGSSRGNWTGQLDFIMSCVSYAVGLGNIWRFPYLCYRNGGAVFLIPYLTFLVLCGMPLFFLEVSYGQFASLSPITVWKMSPLFKGVGYGMVLISGIVCIYYNIIITWTIYYLFMSFNKTLPWSTCNNAWNTDACVLNFKHATPEVNGSDVTGSGANVSAMLGSVVSSTVGGVAFNSTDSIITELQTVKRTSPSEEFWENHVLQLTSGIEDMGGIRWELLGCLALAWVIVFICLIKGIKSSGKVVYFTATFPYMVLTALLIRGVTLPGAYEGIMFYVIPQWDKLLSLKVWGEAAMQIFYSIGAAWGALITFSSYNKFNNDCYRDARIIPVLNSSTSIFAGFAIFSIIGFMAHETGSSIHDVVRQGPGLVFIVYPEAIAKFPLPQLWAVIFFLMLLSVGIGSQFGMFQTMTSAFSDEFPVLRRRKVLLLATLCIAEFLLGIPCVTQGGIYFLQIMDWYSSTFSLMVLSFTECVVIAWIYGIKRFYKDIELMIGYVPCAWWKICWCFVTPTMILFVFSFSIIIHKPVTYGAYTYPGWAIGLGWVFALCSIAPLPIIAFIEMYREEGPMKQRLKKLVHHTEDWGPSDEKDRERYLESRRINEQSLQSEHSEHVEQSDACQKLNRQSVV